MEFNRHMVRAIYETWKTSASICASMPWYFCCAVNPFSMETWCPLVSHVSSPVPHLNAGVLFVWYLCQVKFGNCE